MKVNLRQEITLRNESARIIQEAVRSRIVTRHNAAHIRYLALEAKRQVHLQEKDDAQHKHIKIRLKNPLSGLVGKSKTGDGNGDTDGAGNDGLELEIPVLAASQKRAVFVLKKTLNPFQRQKEDKAARKLQVAYRRKKFLARLKERVAISLRDKREAQMNQKIGQCSLLQSTWRRFAARKYVQKKREARAANRIASVVRGRQCRLCTRQPRAEYRAATSIQRQMRGSRGRARADVQRTWQAAMDKCIRPCQALCRGALTRGHTVELRFSTRHLAEVRTMCTQSFMEIKRQSRGKLLLLSASQYKRAEHIFSEERYGAGMGELQMAFTQFCSYGKRNSISTTQGALSPLEPSSTYSPNSSTTSSHTESRHSDLTSLSHNSNSSSKSSSVHKQHQGKGAKNTAGATEAALMDNQQWIKFIRSCPPLVSHPRRFTEKDADLLFVHMLAQMQKQRTEQLAKRGKSATASKPLRKITFESFVGMLFVISDRLELSTRRNTPTSLTHNLQRTLEAYKGGLQTSLDGKSVYPSLKDDHRGQASMFLRLMEVILASKQGLALDAHLEQRALVRIIWAAERIQNITRQHQGRGKVSGLRNAYLLSVQQAKEQRAAHVLQLCIRRKKAAQKTQLLAALMYRKFWDVYSNCYYYQSTLTGRTQYTKPGLLGSDDVDLAWQLAVLMQRMYRKRISRRRLRAIMKDLYRKDIDPKTDRPKWINKMNGRETFIKPSFLGDEDVNGAAAAERKFFLQRQLNEAAARKERDKTYKAVIRIQTNWRTRQALQGAGAQGSTLLEVKQRRELKRMEWEQRQTDATATKQKWGYAIKDVLGVVPQLGSDTAEEKVLKKLNVVSRTKLQIRAYQLGESVTVLAELGEPLPGQLVPEVGSCFVVTTSSLVEQPANGDKKEEGSLLPPGPAAVVLRPMKGDKVRIHDEVYALNPSADIEAGGFNLLKPYPKDMPAHPAKGYKVDGGLSTGQRATQVKKALANTAVVTKSANAKAKLANSLVNRLEKTSDKFDEDGMINQGLGVMTSWLKPKRKKGHLQVEKVPTTAAVQPNLDVKDDSSDALDGFEVNAQWEENGDNSDYVWEDTTQAGCDETDKSASNTNEWANWTDTDNTTWIETNNASSELSWDASETQWDEGIATQGGEDSGDVRVQGEWAISGVVEADPHLGAQSVPEADPESFNTPEWVQYTDDATQCNYWYNSNTQETVWE
jgi:hypothetical protein